MSDPRVSGEGRVAFEGDWQSNTSSTNYALWGEYSLTNDGGTWEGEWTGFVDLYGNHHIMSWLRGTGDYEGLSFLVSADQQPDGELDLTGLIYPGELPSTVVLGMEDEPSS